MIKAFILDLDNTIYPASSIGPELFEPLFELLEKHKQEIGEDNISQIKQLLMKKAWQKIAEQFGISDEIVTEGSDILREASYDKPMQAFPDYALVKHFDQDQYLVTMGFTKMQETKVRMLNLEPHFKEVHVNDPEKSEDTKKEIFEDILTRNGYQPNEVLVIGDDPDSEIKAGLDLGIITVLYDRNNEFLENNAQHRINNFSELKAIVDSYQD